MGNVVVWNIIVLCGVVVLVEAALYVFRRAKFQHAAQMLHRAKQEVQDLSRLSLNTPYPLIQMNMAGDIVFANPAALENFAKLRLLGRAHPVLDRLEQCFSSDDSLAREVHIGDTVYHQTVIPVGHGDDRKLIIYCYNITERKIFENKIMQANKVSERSRREAERAMNARGEFLANMSHELRTPMNGIIGLSDMLLSMEENAEKLELCGSINSSSKSLLILLNDILDFSKIEAGELQVESIPCDLRQLVEQVELLHKTVASQKALVLESHISDDFPPYVMGDGARIQQVLNNLISNAIKFTDEGRITVDITGAVNKKGQFVSRFRVRDTGVGIAKAKQGNVFEKFQQADSSTARKYGGTGLGLAITKNLIELMGGTLHLASEEGQGTCISFDIAMPIAQNAPQDDVRAKNKSAEHAQLDRQRKIMIVDDHPVNLLYMRMVLQKLGFTNFDEATNGQSALDMARTTHYDLILMDCQMPEMDGFMATKRIRELPSLAQEGGKPPIIIAVTADAMQGAKESCLAAGMNDYISKPVDKKTLEGLLIKWLPCREGSAAGEAQDVISFGDVVDRKRLKEFTEGDAAVEEQIISIFLDSLKVDIMTLRHLFKAHKYEEWKGVVHKLYGAASNMGVEKLSKLCEGVLDTVDAKEETVKRFHLAICQEYQNICTALVYSKAG